MVPQLTRFPHQGVLKTSPPSKSPGKHLCKKPLAPVKRSSQGTQDVLSIFQFSSVQAFSHVQLFATPWTVAHQGFLSITSSWSLLKLMSINSVMSSSHLILCCPLLLLPSILPSIRTLFQRVSFLHQVAKVLEFQLQHQSFQ